MGLLVNHQLICFLIWPKSISHEQSCCRRFQVIVLLSLYCPLFLAWKNKRPKRDLEKCYQCRVSIEILLDLKVWFSLEEREKLIIKLHSFWPVRSLKFLYRDNSANKYILPYNEKPRCNITDLKNKGDFENRKNQIALNCTSYWVQIKSTIHKGTFSSNWLKKKSTFEWTFGLISFYFSWNHQKTIG